MTHEANEDIHTRRDGDRCDDEAGDNKADADAVAIALASSVSGENAASMCRTAAVSADRGCCLMLLVSSSLSSLPPMQLGTISTASAT